ncbi:MAG: TonB-dependent receptor [Candidatus Eisenbacteria bacterium]|nr:TonB-dependent receptor [Candidatus Eisenbacteria bacterium]
MHVTRLAPARMLTVAFFAALAAASPVFAAPTADDPFSIVRDEQTVIGAAKRPQPLSETPSAVTVITAEEIHAHGYRSLAEALRWVRGVFVTDDRNYSYVGVRGLQRPGDYNNKVLLAIDGHTMNGNVYADGLFGGELGLDLENVERIEVVRGPGSALYGGYAVLAVVNVVTRRPSRDPGVAVGGWSGSARSRRGFATIASSRPGRPEWSISGSWLGSRGADLYFPALDGPLTHNGMSIGADGEDAHAFFATAEWLGVRLVAKTNERMKRISTGSFGTTFDDSRNRTYDGHDYVELSGARELSQAFELHGRVYWDDAHYHGYYVYGPDSATYVNYDAGDGEVLGTELRAHWSPEAGEVVTLGVEGQIQPRIELVNYDIAPYVLHLDKEARRHTVAAYAEDEQRLGAATTATAGIRVDDTPGFAPVASPRLDIVWRSSPTLTWKLLAGSAFRAPSLYETEYEAQYTLANPWLGPERVVTLEGGLVRAAGPLTWTLSAYANRVRGLIDLVQVDSLNQRFGNRQRVLSRGVEGEVAVVRAGGTRARLALAWQTSMDEDLDRELSNSPRWNGHVTVTHAPPESRYTLGAGLRVLSPRVTLAGARTAWATVADARVAVRVGRATELGFEVRNLLDARYGDPGSSEQVMDQIAQDGRTLSATLTVRPPLHP